MSARPPEIYRKSYIKCEVIFLSYSDDQISSAKPFSGDETGTIFNTPDVVLQSPTTSERIVDTQSGFLVVIKHLSSRLTLSVRRRIGTPPSSSILLTPDEALRLSQILTEEKPEPAANTPYTIKVPTRDLKQLLSPLPLEEKTDFLEPDFKARRHSARKQVSKPLMIVAVAAAVLLAASWLFKGGFINRANKQILTEAEIESRVDQFARNYVIYLLDFNPQTYRFSQIQAMSSMSTELMEKYWQETHFPITSAQLRNAGQTRTLVVTKVLQERPDDANVRLVEVFAEMKNRQDERAKPVHLQLKLETSEQGQSRVLDQKDMG